MIASISVFSSAFAGVVAYVLDCASVFVSVFVSVSVFPSDADVADLFLIADPVEVAAAVKTLRVVQKQSLI